MAPTPSRTLAHNLVLMWVLLAVGIPIAVRISIIDIGIERLIYSGASVNLAEIEGHIDSDQIHHIFG